MQYPNISPILFQFGPLQVRWYGIMYIAGFAFAWFILRHLIKTNFLRLKINQVEDLIIAMFCGMLIGARAFYMLVYYAPAPGTTMAWWEPFAVWQGGLSFHGALIGMIVTVFIFAHFYKVNVLNLMDSISLCGYGALFFGRIGNFINSELYGRVTDVAWAMSFPLRDWNGNVIGWTEPRHPSQIYEALAEGILCFTIVWTVKHFTKRTGIVTASGMIAYGCLRFICEFFREPDAELGYYFNYFTMGQILCTLMVLLGIGLLIYLKYHSEKPAETSENNNQLV